MSTSTKGFEETSILILFIENINQNFLLVLLEFWNGTISLGDC